MKWLLISILCIVACSNGSNTDTFCADYQASQDALIAQDQHPVPAEDVCDTQGRCSGKMWYCRTVTGVVVCQQAF